MTVFVTGGNGFIGSRVVARLRADGHAVRCLLRPSSKTARIDGLGWQRHDGDVTDLDALRAGMRGCDAVIHLASISAWDQIRSPKMPEVVIGGTGKVLAAAKEAGNLRVVFVSSSTAVRGTQTPEICDETASFNLDERFLYANAKHRAEALCRAASAEGLPVVTVCPCETYGPGDDDLITAANLIDMIKGWPALAVAGGTAIAHVDDMAAGIVAALMLGRPGERYILGGDNLSVRDLVALTLDVAGKRTPILQPPNWLVRWLIGALVKLGLPTPVIPDVVDYATLYWFFDCSKAKAELGYQHRPARQVIEETVAWLRESGRI